MEPSGGDGRLVVLHSLVAAAPPQTTYSLRRGYHLLREHDASHDAPYGCSYVHDRRPPRTPLGSKSNEYGQCQRHTEHPDDRAAAEGGEVDQPRHRIGYGGDEQGGDRPTPRESVRDAETERSPRIAGRVRVPMAQISGVTV